MKKPIIYGLALALAAPLCAQGVLYSPKDLASAEGQYYAYYFFRYSDSRWQNVDGENTGKAAVINNISLRRDGTYNYNSSYGTGRSWSNLQLQVSEGSLANFSTTFSSNATTTPTTVYNSKWSIPTVTGVQSPAPSPWGGPNGSLKIPFTTPFVYTGKADILTDWQYTGGMLDNAAAWSGSTSRYYMLDSYGSANEYSSLGSTYGYMPTTRLNNNSTGVTGRCNDSEHGTTTTGAYQLMQATLYAPKYVVENYAGRLYFYTYSYYTGYETPIIHGVSVTNNATGVDLGTGCNKLHLQAPIFMRPTVTMPSSYSSSGYSRYRFDLVKWQNAFSSVTLTAQTGWADSSTSAFNLSQARTATLPSGFPGPAPMRSATYHYTGTSATGLGPYTTYIYSPAFAYSTK